MPKKLELRDIEPLNADYWDIKTCDRCNSQPAVQGDYKGTGLVYCYRCARELSLPLPGQKK
jgi:hypothetical protein